MISFLSEVLYPGVGVDLSRVMLALVLGHMFHHNILLLIVLTVCSLPLLLLSWLHGGDPFLVFFWVFSWAIAKDKDKAPETDPAAALKRGGGIRRKFRESLGSLVGNDMRKLGLWLMKSVQGFSIRHFLCVGDSF
jgi:hypothetical protein